MLYVDAARGASGDMILGCLVDLGVPLETLRSALEQLPIRGWTIAARKIDRCGLACTKVEVEVEQDSTARRWRDIEAIVRSPGLAPRVSERALAIFRRLIEAEAEAHGASPERAHLHEAGAVDAIVDVVGACVGLEHLRVDEIVVSEMTTGFGEVRCAHGVYPVPAPATALLVRGAPVRGGDVEAERLTPTGAAVLTTLVDRWGALPSMRPLAVGHGAGSKEFGDTPNLLRMILGEAGPDAATLEGIAGDVAVLECTVDDATPQAIAFAAERLLDEGALDAYTSPVTMKKGRLGHHLTVLSRPEHLSRLARRLLSDTSTLGLRFRGEKRYELERIVRRVETRFGPVGVKLGLLDGRVVHAWPEYDDCAALAERHGAPLGDVQQAALERYASIRDSSDPHGSEEESRDG
jgi:uncharacterized protein (TIGR00299 family) protein